MSSFFLNHPRETDLALFAGGELGPIARWRIERHLDKCGRCQTEVADFFHLQSDLSDLAELPAVDFQALAHRIKVAAAQAQPETEPVSVTGWFRQPAAWRLGVVSATALCAFVVYKQLPLVKTGPENPVFFEQVAVEGLLRAEGDQLGQTEASAPAEEEALRSFAFHRLEESAQKADVAQDLDDAEHARQLPSESARQKAKQVTAPDSQSVAAPAARVSGRADRPASAAVAKVKRTTINRTIGGSAEGLSSGISDELEENLRTNTELANAGLENAELGVNEKLRAIASDTKVAVVSGEAQFKKESSGSLQDGRTGGYREQPELNAQLQDAQLQAGHLQDDQSRDSASQQQPQPAQAPASVLDELKEADLSASAIQGRGRAAVKERDYLGGDQVDKNAPADPDNQPEPVAGARKPVTLAVNKGPAESRIVAQEAGAGERVTELEKSGFAAGEQTSNAETFADTQFSVLPAAWNDSNTEVGVAANGGMMIRALDSATGTITITNVYLP